jgi:hypothetical protein
MSARDAKPDVADLGIPDIASVSAGYARGVWVIVGKFN